jgi:hypothetical protein
LDLSYSNGWKRYDFSTDEGFYYPGCDPKYYDIKDVGPKAFRRGYVKALFTENRNWLTLIENYHMIVPGSRKNKRDDARDLAAKEHLREQVSPDTFEDRKAFFEAWKDASCCADDCEQYCDECLNKNIQFKSVPTFELDADVRRYITKRWRYQTTSELKEDENVRSKKSTGTILSGVCDRKSDNDPVWVRGQERGGLPGEPEEVSSDQAERVQALLSHPISEEMVT